MRKELELFSKRVRDERSVVVFGCMSYKGTADLVGIQENMDLEYFLDDLQNSLIPNTNV